MDGKQGIQDWLGDKDLAICQLEDHGYDGNPRFVYTEISGEYAEKLAEQYRDYQKEDKS
jgi:hypothetical protein